MRIIVFVVVMLLSACVAHRPMQEEGAASKISGAEVYLQSGVNHLSSRRTKQAIADFDKVIVLCNEKFSNEKRRVYASRGMKETLFYMMKSAGDEEEAIVIDTVCAESLYLKAYASLDLGMLEQAEANIKNAVEMSPVNSKYLSELGHVYHSKREWNTALDVFIKAEEAAATYSPAELKQQELTRAKRGVGFSLIELGRLEDASAKFNECLVLDKNDQTATKELQYIEHLKRNMP